MPNFRYNARTKDGVLQSGTIAAANRMAALALLQEHDLIVTLVKEEASDSISQFLERLKFWERVKQKHIVLLSRQLSVLFAAGVPLVEALRTLHEEAETPRLAEMLFAITEDVNGGTSLSEALEKHPNAFSNFFVMMVRSGEASGRLEEALRFLADYLERNYELNSKVKRAMAYPAFILFTFMVVALFLTIVVVPSLAKVFSETGQQLPLATRMLIVFSTFLRSYGWVVLILLIPVVVLLVRYVIKTEDGHRAWDWVKINVPIFKSLLQRLYLERFSENLGTLMQSGISMTQALEISAGVVGNVYYKTLLLEALEGVKRGEPLSAMLFKSPLVPRVISTMVAVGEKTGKIDSIFATIARFYQRELDAMIDGLVSLIEPLLIAVLGGAVAVLVASILLPIYRLTSGL